MIMRNILKIASCVVCAMACMLALRSVAYASQLDERRHEAGRDLFGRSIETTRYQASATNSHIQSINDALRLSERQELP